MVKVKVCGLTNEADALKAVELGAEMLGFVFYGDSPRSVSPEEARKIIEKIPPEITTVGVFVNESPERVWEILSQTGINVAQLHGDETPADCKLPCKVIKAIRVKEAGDLDALSDYDVWAYLLDTYSEEAYGGTGRSFDWELAAGANRAGRIILAGGLTHVNVALAVRCVKPYAVDVSSGVEREIGVKDHEKMRLFIERAKGGQ